MTAAFSFAGFSFGVSTSAGASALWTLTKNSNLFVETIRDVSSKNSTDGTLYLCRIGAKLM